MRFYTADDIAGFDSVDFLYIKTFSETHVFRIRLNRPEKRNAFTPTMAEEIIYALSYAHYNSHIRCVIIEAEGSVFCAGADLGSFHQSGKDLLNHTLPRIREEARLGDAFDQLKKPCIAKVEGSVLAGGFLIICGCSFVLTIHEAMFGLPEVKRGIWPMQVMASMLRITSKRNFLEMALTGNLYSAQETKHMGVVTHLVSKEQIAQRTDELAAQICANAPLAINKGYETLTMLTEIEGDQQHAYLKQQLDILLQSEDAKEGTAAFVEKRQPVWKNR